MERSRYSLVLALLVLLPARGICGDGDEDNGRGDAANRAVSKPSSSKSEHSPSESEHSPVKRASGPAGQRARRDGLPRGTRERSLECFVCAYKSESPLRACLDPIKFRVPAVPCRGADEECFAEVLPQGGALEALERGCRSHCVGSADTSCCEFNRCNSQAFAASPPAKRETYEEKKWKIREDLNKQMEKAEDDDLTDKTSPPPGTLLFVTALLVLQTVAKVLFE